MERSVYVFNHAKPFEELPEKVTGEIVVGPKNNKKMKGGWGGWVDKGLVTRTHYCYFLTKTQNHPVKRMGWLGGKNKK